MKSQPFFRNISISKVSVSDLGVASVSLSGIRHAFKRIGRMRVGILHWFMLKLNPIFMSKFSGLSL